VSAALTRLLECGVVVRAGEEFVAAPPAIALGALITERRDALRRAELALAALAEEHRAVHTGRSISELIEVVTGADAVRHRFLQVQQAAETQIRTFVTAPFVAVPMGDNTAEDAAVGRGVTFRIVLDRNVLAEPGAVAEAIDSLRMGVQVRVAESLPMKLVLADSELALVPLAATEDEEPGAVLLHRSGLLAGLDALFESVWATAYPLEAWRLAGDDLTVLEDENVGLHELDRKILALLLSGLTDQAVASQLDLSLRTLQRRLRELMDRAGVDTRMQLGWRAAKDDWA
jgi:DNA-binding CsgD family transcriptional regulator